MMAMMAVAPIATSPEPRDLHAIGLLLRLSRGCSLRRCRDGVRQRNAASGGQDRGREQELLHGVLLGVDGYQGAGAAYVPVTQKNLLKTMRYEYPFIAVMHHAA